MSHWNLRPDLWPDRRSSQMKTCSGTMSDRRKLYNTVQTLEAELQLVHIKHRLRPLTPDLRFVLTSSQEHHYIQTGELVLPAGIFLQHKPAHWHAAWTLNLMEPSARRAFSSKYNCLHCRPALRLLHHEDNTSWSHHMAHTSKTTSSELMLVTVALVSVSFHVTKCC